MNDATKTTLTRARHPLVLLAAAALPAWALGCTGPVEPASSGFSGKADGVGSCSAETATHCGGRSPDGCWCDADCSDFGNCCADYLAVCVAPHDPMAALAVALTTPDVVTMPPVGQRYYANALSVTARVVDVSEGRSGVVRRTVEEIAAEFLEHVTWDDYPTSDGIFALSALPDASHHYVHDRGPDSRAREYLVGSLLASPAGASVVEQVPTGADFAWFHVHDIGAEIRGHDVVFIMPYGLDTAVVLRVDFEQR